MPTAQDQVVNWCREQQVLLLGIADRYRGFMQFPLRLGQRGLRLMILERDQASRKTTSP
jgi:hypothetical protein